MNRRAFLRGAGGVLAGSTLASLTACGSPAPQDAAPANDQSSEEQSAASSPAITWRMPTSWTESLGVLLDTAKLIANRVAEMTEGQFTIEVMVADENISALEVFDAVQQRTVECGHTVSFYSIEKEESLGFASGLPFGLTAQQQNAWLYYGGGWEAVQRVFDEFGIKNFPAGGTGTQMGGWFKQEINTLADLQNIKMRIPGLGGRVMEQLGVETVLLSGGEIVEALKSGVVDAAEWIGPHDDETLGLNQVADFYYYPGWWEPGTTAELLVNRAAWDNLPPMYQEILRTATYEANSLMLSQYEVLNQTALARLVASGTQLRAYSGEILAAARNAAFELYEEIARNNVLFREIFKNWKTFRRDMYQWNRFNELTFTRFASQGIF
jgi:TRAP-type mannitol/chloroaromatic compound transport system substrate-binding protein